MASVNKVILIGNVGSDPELNQTQSGTSYMRFSVATTERTGKKDGEKKELTEWHRCVMFDKVAEALAPYMSKGKQVYVEGKLRTRQWEKDGQNHYSTEIIVNEIKLLGSKPASAGESQAQQKPKPPAQPATKTASKPQAKQQDDIDEDDLPF